MCTNPVSDHQGAFELCDVILLTSAATRAWLLLRSSSPIIELSCTTRLLSWIKYVSESMVRRHMDSEPWSLLLNSTDVTTRRLMRQRGVGVSGQTDRGSRQTDRQTGQQTVIYDHTDYSYWSFILINHNDHSYWSFILIIHTDHSYTHREHPHTESIHTQTRGRVGTSYTPIQVCQTCPLPIQTGSFLTGFWSFILINHTNHSY